MYGFGYGVLGFRVSGVSSGILTRHKLQGRDFDSRRGEIGCLIWVHLSCDTAQGFTVWIVDE